MNPAAAMVIPHHTQYLQLKLMSDAEQSGIDETRPDQQNQQHPHATPGCLYSCARSVKEVGGYRIGKGVICDGHETGVHQSESGSMIHFGM